MTTRVATSVTRTTHTVPNADGVPISVDCVTVGAVRPVAIVICPGFFQSKDTPTFQRLAQRLADRWDVVAMDFRGHGRSGGLYTFSAREGADLSSVLEWAGQRYRTLGVLGFSMGAAIAMTTVGKFRPLVCSLASISGPSSFEEIEFKFWTPEAMRTGWQGCELGVGCRPGSWWLPKPKPLEAVAQLDGLPKLFVHGTRDMIVGLPHSQRLHDAAAAPTRLEIIDGGSHAEALFRDAPEPFYRLLVDWWIQTLPSTEE